jgi:Fe2+ transport system protein FeoA
MRLDELAVGAHGTVKGFSSHNPALVRLREMGLLPGTRIKLVRRAPLGDPLDFEVRGYHLSLRQVDAALVELNDPAS